MSFLPARSPHEQWLRTMAENDMAEATPRFSRYLALFASKSSRVRFGLLALAGVFAIFLELTRPPLLTRFDENVRDVALRLLAQRAPEERIAVIDIDEESLRRHGQWPWPRTVVADLVEHLLTEHGARSVILDIVFPDAAQASEDARLISLAEHAPLVLAQILDYSVRQPALAQGMLIGGTLASDTSQALPATGFIGNHQGFAAARCSGNIGYVPDEDGVLRHIPLQTHFQGRNYPNLALATLACDAQTSIPWDKLPANRWRIPYHRSLHAYTVIPAHEVLSGSVSSKMLSGRFVLIGSSALSLGDRASTPLAPLVAGVMVHASILSAWLDVAEQKIPLPWSGRGLLGVWLFLSLVTAGLAISRSRPWFGILALLGIALTWLLLAALGVKYQAQWSLTAPLWAYLVVLLLVLPYELLLAQRRIRRVIETLSHYVSRPVLDEILRNHLEYSLRPTLREVTVLIADIEGYTQLTSQLSLNDAARLTKEVLECLTQPLLAAGGTLDKYSGDGLVAFWGAPLPNPEQADVALASALEMLRLVADYNQHTPAHWPPVRVRIGIESGQALVGDLGTSFRSTYTAVGDCINFASRLEDAARGRTPPLLIGPQARNKLKRYRTQSAGTITLRGTRTPIEVFQPKPLPDEQA